MKCNLFLWCKAEFSASLLWSVTSHDPSEIMLIFSIKVIVHPKMKIRSSFTHPRVVPNLYEFLCSAKHKGKYSEECNKYFFPTMEVNGAQKQPDYKLSSKYLPLCSAEQRHSYSFGTTRGWVNDERIFIFGWTISLRCGSLMNRKFKRKVFIWNIRSVCNIKSVSFDQFIMSLVKKYYL